MAGNAQSLRASGPVGAERRRAGSANPPASKGFPMTTKPSEQTRTRYYLASLDMSLEQGAGLWFANEDDALVNGRTAGTRELNIPSLPYPIPVGVPPFRETPLLVVSGDGSVQPPDFYGPIPSAVSNRAKELLERIDPEGFEFAETHTVSETGRLLEPYWWMSVVRVVAKFDEERSDFVRYRDKFPAAPDAQSNPTMFVINDVRMPEDFPAANHAFQLAHYRNYPVFSEVIVDAWRERGLTGAQFTPLQPPTEVDFETHLGFVNYPYWTEKVRDPC